MAFQMNGPPEPIVSDYVELITLILLFIIGAPVNLAAYTQIAERPACTRLDILKRHLNYSDLLVLFIYVPSRACWLITYDWRGGDFLCRFIKFMHTFAFQVSSNVIVCIAVDRLMSVISASHHNPERAHRRMQFILSIAWITALLISAPQFAIWRNYVAFEDIKWSQCMQIWEILRAEAFFKNSTAANANTLMQEENIYVVLHMLCIFWIPAFVILMCYVIVSCWVYFNSKPSSLFVSAVSECAQKTARGRMGIVSYHSNAETIDTMVTKSQAANPKIMINDELTRPLSSRRESADGGGQSTKSGSSVSANNLVVNNGTIRQTSVQSAMRNSHSSSYSAKINRSRAIRVSFLLVAAYIICWLPYNGLSLIQFVDPDLFNKHANQVYCLHGMIVFNSVINPYLYGLFGGICRPRKAT